MISTFALPYIVSESLIALHTSDMYAEHIAKERTRNVCPMG